MAIVKVLDVEFTGEGLNAPKLIKVDPIESDGSLLLLDMSRVSSLPSNGGTFTNLFKHNAFNITGESTTLTYYENFENPSIAKVERTSKGGLYFVTKDQVFSPYPLNYVNIKATGGVKKWIKDHWNVDNQTNDHVFYYSLWIRHVTASDKDMYNMNYSDNSNHNFRRAVFMQFNSTGLKRKAQQGLYGDAGYPVLDTTEFNIFNGGRVGLNAHGYSSRKYESVIFYRFYVEDLTISGRTFAEVNAIDAQLFSEAFAPGGKFHGDTYTEPNTAFS